MCRRLHSTEHGFAAEFNNRPTDAAKTFSVASLDLPRLLNHRQSANGVEPARNRFVSVEPICGASRGDEAVILPLDKDVARLTNRSRKS